MCAFDWRIWRGGGGRGAQKCENLLFPFFLFPLPLERLPSPSPLLAAINNGPGVKEYGKRGEVLKKVPPPPLPLSPFPTTNPNEDIPFFVLFIFFSCEMWENEAFAVRVWKYTSTKVPVFFARGTYIFFLSGSFSSFSILSLML